MKTNRFMLAGLVFGVLTLSMLACSLTGGAPQAGTAVPPPAATESAAPTQAPLAGPALSHFASGQKITVAYIHMANPNVGWAIGGQAGAADHVFRTKDGGETWQDVTPPETSPAPGTQIRGTGYFSDANSGWVVYAPGEGEPAPASVRIWSTRDAGVTWRYASLDTSAFQETFVPSVMLFVDASHGWFLAHLGRGMNHDYVAVVATSDGGATWKVANDPNNDTSGMQSCTKTGMAFADPQTGWLSLDCNGVDPVPHLYLTADGGATWQRVDLAAPAGESDLFTADTCGMYSPLPLSASSGVFSMKCLDNATSKVEKDFLYWTDDSGKSWRTAAYPGGEVLFFGQQGLALGHTLSATSDGGQTWTKRLAVVWDGQFSFLDADLGWAVATNQGAIALVKTTDGGSSWVQLSPQVGP